MAVAHGLVEAGAHVPWLARDRLPVAFAFDAEGSRQMLSSVATSMITIAGVAFSITIVVLSLTSTQYSPRVLQQFMRDRTNQWVLGVFVGVFAYCLTVLPRVRGEGAHEFVPAVAVAGGLLYGLIGVGCLIFFIHHIATSIQVSHIVAEIAAETRHTADVLFPAEPRGETPAELAATERGSFLTAAESGYIQLLDEERLLVLAQEHDLTIRMERGVGEFVVAGAAVMAVSRDGERHTPEPALADELRDVLTINRARTIEQDVRFGVRQIVDVALRALSPSLNDPTTACICVHYLTTILVPLASRRLGHRRRVRDSKLRLVLCEPAFDELLTLAFGEIRANADRQALVLRALLQGLETLSSAATTAEVRLALTVETRAVRDRIGRISGEPTVPALMAAADRLLDVLDSSASETSAAGDRRRAP